MKFNQIDFKKILIWAFLPVLFWGSIVMVSVYYCSHKAESTTQMQEVNDKVQKLGDESQYSSETRVALFRLPEIPVTLKESQQRAEYLALHYWDHYNFTDTASVHPPEDTEQVLSDYIAILPYVTRPIVENSVIRLLSKAEEHQDMLLFFAGLLEKYLYDPNSPFRNEEYYLLALRFIETCTALDEVRKSRYLFQLGNVLKNRQGTIASDFVYMLHDGRKGRLHGIRSEYTLLYFYDPDCPDCRHTREMLAELPTVVALVQSGRLQIVAFYPDGEAEAWEACRNIIPDTWLNTCDGTEELVVREKLYAIRAVPSLYLLDSEKRVILKDTDYNKLDAWLNGPLSASL